VKVTNIQGDYGDNIAIRKANRQNKRSAVDVKLEGRYIDMECTRALRRQANVVMCDVRIMSQRDERRIDNNTTSAIVGVDKRLVPVQLPPKG
jgi:hypothetical protein